MVSRASWLIVSAVLGLGCLSSDRIRAPSAPNEPASDAEAQHGRADPHSVAEPDRVRVRHLGLDWTVDFEARRLRGVATFSIERADPGAPLRLDTRALSITSVAVGQAAGVEPASLGLAELPPGAVDWNEARYTLHPPTALGAELEITLPSGADRVRVTYETTADSTGLQWLDPAQTEGGVDPFLYSQSQAIHARSWIPCQDTPGVRITYDAVVRTPDGLVPLMSAERLASGEPGVHRFAMTQPIPSYLVALAVGRLEFRALSERAGVWAEPTTLGRAADEFADVERMMAAAERLYGPYRWGRYDVLVLPPAFPFGGMENPRMTFATPTILAGDRSLVALVAHELAHSWSGNLVTNATWRDIWLNEGFTVYIERRIIEELFGAERARMEASLGRQDLERAIEELAPADQHLVADLRGRDPDDGLNDIPYEKGALLLTTLEHRYGRATFDAFLRAWFDEHAFTSVDTEAFVRFATASLIEPHAEAGVPDLAGWLRGPGIGPGAVTPSGNPFEAVDAEVVRFEQGVDPAELKVDGFTPHEWLRFLRALDDVPTERLAALDEVHHLTRSGNAEIVAQWLQVSILGGYRDADARLEEFLLRVGRRKFLMPLYRCLLEVGRRDEALAIYRRARAGYHPITRQSLDDLLGA